ncbi:MAG TPA: D-arabinono-1,4-lactone oxidase [Solirubrobacterales bacterium]|jgi:L-gulonolactone oxidase|nr:D-arabinono-1,4-lactone oxidase [Solirubrobacterales bacterium]
MTAEWTNWSGNQRFTPAERAEPRDLEELRTFVADAARRGKIRAVGNGHSFNDLVATDGTLVSLAQMQGLVDADPASGLVKVHAGTSIYELSRLLDGLGLALPNLGDIDVQAIAGAVATGTHGTGARYASVSAQVAAIEMVTASGDLVSIDAADETALKAARVSLGTLGIASELTLQCVPAFTLDRLDLPSPLDETLAQFDELADSHDHFEFYVFPYTDVVIQKRINRTDQPPHPWSKRKRFLNDVAFENWTLAALVNAGKLMPRAIPALARGVTKTFGKVHKVDKSHEIFSTVRNVRFNELEYAIPRKRVAAALTRILAAIEEHRWPVNFPIEVRVGRADEDCLLATAAGRETGYISVHMYRGMEFEPYFRAVESIMNDYDGRPHWGKLHWQTAETLAPRYPGWDDFQAVRSRLDPGGVFSNRYTDRVLGPVVASPTS